LLRSPLDAPAPAHRIKFTGRATEPQRVPGRFYERSALILDAKEHPLAQVSMSLSVMGLRPIYSDDLDELVALAAERRDQLGALLLPGAHASDWWEAVRKDVLEPLGLPPCAVLPVGPRIAAPGAEALHANGLRWALWEPFSPWELRFVVSMVLIETDPGDSRTQSRVPCSIPCEVDSQSRSLPAQITDLSTGGAFVQLAHPLAENASVVLRGALCGHPVTMEARVAWRSGPSSPSWLDRGMGLEFQRTELATLDLLRQQVGCSLERFRLRGQ